jgi:hypothetical protein
LSFFVVSKDPKGFRVKRASASQEKPLGLEKEFIKENTNAKTSCHYGIGLYQPGWE